MDAPLQTDDARTNRSVAERFERVKELVLAKRPVLRTILERQGAKSLATYANEYVDVNMNPPIQHRQMELLSTVEEAATERYGSDIAKGLVAQLEKYYFVSTADHVGPIDFPFFLNSDLLIGLTIHAHTDPALRYIPVFPCANISLNNHSFPRGLLFNARGTDGTVKLQRLSFLPSNAHSCSAYNFRAYFPEEIDKMKKRLREMTREGSVSQDIAAKVERIIDEIYSLPEILQCTSFRDQVARSNRLLWNKFFEASGAKIPQLLYLDQEDMVIRLITKYHLHADTVINHILFDPVYEPYIDTYFEGIFGSFSRKDQTGTYLFWALPKGSKLNKQLWKKGNFLVTADESYRVELTPEAIGAAMASGELIPSLLLNFVTICFYYGLKCLGGFNQVNYLTLMKDAYIRMNLERGNYRSIEVCSRAQTKEICDGPSLAFLGYGNDGVTLATGLDLILYGDSDSWSRLKNLAENLTLEESLNPFMPEIYKISYDESEWERDLLSLSEHDINHLTGIDRKIKPCVRIG